MTEIGIGVIAFTLIIFLLSLFVLGARRLLVPSGTMPVTVNARKTVTAQTGQRLLDALTQGDVLLPGACGGKGTCGLCKVEIVDGDKQAGAQEQALLSREESKRGIRLACQVPVLDAIAVNVDESSFGIKTWQCKVVSTHQVATFVREIVLALPDGEALDFRAGGFVEINAPPYQLQFSELDIDDRYSNTWASHQLGALQVRNRKHETRAYSLANGPQETHSLRLNIRIALPPDHKKNVTPGIVSSWLFSLRPGDTVQVNGCYGHFFVEPTQKECVFIGGGVGMAPLRAQILDLFEQQKTQRTVSFWYGGRSVNELYYTNQFDALQTAHDNFNWHLVLSDPAQEDHWQGLTGFVHQAVFDHYLKAHPAPEDCEYYVCGPPLMIQAVRDMLDTIGVDADAIHYDDFGS